MRTNRFDSEIEKENSEKDEDSSFFGTKAKSKGSDPIKIEVLTLLLTTLSLAGNNLLSPSPRKVWSKQIQESCNFFHSAYQTRNGGGGILGWF